MHLSVPALLALEMVVSSYAGRGHLAVGEREGIQLLLLHMAMQLHLRSSEIGDEWLVNKRLANRPFGRPA